MLHLTAGRLLSRTTFRVLTTTSPRPLLRSLPRPKPTTPLLRHNARSFSPPSPKKPPPPPPATANETPLSPSQPSLRERVWAAGQLSDLGAPPEMSSAQRLLRPTLFTLLVIGGSLYYAYAYTTPRPSERWFPTVPIAFATVAGIIGINLAVFVAWKIPLPVTWRVLNKYFVSVPALPYSASMLGSAFSHQTLTHLGVNMFVLYSLGTSLCEQIGAGPFLGLYTSGAVVSSLASLAWNVVRQKFGVVSLGASGAISTVVGVYAYINPDAELYIIFLPFMVFKAKVVVGFMACMEVVGITRGWAVLDHVAHLSGLMWGVVGGWALMKEYKRRMERRRKEKGIGWW